MFNTHGNPENLLELFFPPGNLLEIYKLSWKFSGLVCEFAHLSLILVTFLYFRLYQYKVYCGSIDIEVSNLGQCQLTHLLIRVIGVGWGLSPHASSFNLLTA